MYFPFLHPCSIIIAGPSGSGKTVFIRKIITENMLAPSPSRIEIVYGEWQKEYDLLHQLHPTIEFIKGPIEEGFYEKFNPLETNLLILDDQMSEMENSNELVKLFTQGSHHRSLSIILLLQNIFQKGKAIRTATLNAKYIVLFKNPRDKTQAAVLGRQMYPSKEKAFISALDAATRTPYSYLLVDLQSETPEEYRLRGNIFPSDGNPGVDIYII